MKSISEGLWMMECDESFAHIKIPPRKFGSVFKRKSSSSGAGSPDVWGFYEPDTGSIQYLVADPETKEAALIDVVMLYDPASGRVSTAMADSILEFADSEKLTISWILDTHPHADHLMASHYLHCRTNAPTGIGVEVKKIAELWQGYYNRKEGFDVEGSFSHLFQDGETFKLGSMEGRVMFSPGHTLGSITYIFGDAAFVHDTFMYPDSGTSRADFPGGSVDDLWSSLQAILNLDDNTRLFVGHDYCGGDREDPAWEATVTEQRAHNIHLAQNNEQSYKKLRTERDQTLGLPLRILPALQVNLNGGRLPDAEDDGERYLKLPVNRF